MMYEFSLPQKVGLAPAMQLRHMFHRAKLTELRGLSYKTLHCAFLRVLTNSINRLQRNGNSVDQLLKHIHGVTVTRTAGTQGAESVRQYVRRNEDNVLR